MSEPGLTREDPRRDDPAPPCGVVGLSVDLPSLPIGPAAAERGRWAASLFAAATAHVFALMAAIAPADLGPVGAGGETLEAINVEIVSSAALESRSSRAPPAAAPRAEVDPDADGGLPMEAAAAAVDQAARQAPADAEMAGPLPDLVAPEAKPEEPRVEPVEVALMVAESKPEQPADNEPDAAKAAPAETAAASRASAPSEAAEQGGAAARGIETADVRGRPAAAASAGAASEYAKAVIETLARRKPRATAGVRGTVRIGFAVAHSGEVREARIVMSSGQSLLDEAALAAVRAVRFPAPPPELTTAQLSYEIPYIFR